MSQEPFTLVRHWGVTGGELCLLLLLLSTSYYLTIALQHTYHPSEDTSSHSTICHFNTTSPIILFLHIICCAFSLWPGPIHKTEVMFHVPWQCDALPTVETLPAKELCCQWDTKKLSLDRGGTAWQWKSLWVLYSVVNLRTHSPFNTPVLAVKLVLFYNLKSGLILQSKGWTKIPTLNTLLLRCPKKWALAYFNSGEGTSVLHSAVVLL